MEFVLYSDNSLFKTRSLLDPSNRPLERSHGEEKYLDLDVPKIDTQLLQQRRFPFIPLGPKRRQPARPQSTLLPHPPAHSPVPKRGGAASTDTEPGTVGGVRGGCCARVGGIAVAVLGLRGRGMAGDGLGGVSGGVEL